MHASTERWIRGSYITFCWDLPPLEEVERVEVWRMADRNTANIRLEAFDGITCVDCLRELCSHEAGRETIEDYDEGRGEFTLEVCVDCGDVLEQ